VLIFKKVCYIKFPSFINFGYNQATVRAQPEAGKYVKSKITIKRSNQLDGLNAEGWQGLRQCRVSSGNRYFDLANALTGPQVLTVLSLSFSVLPLLL
jgi:hypothetical protein